MYTSLKEEEEEREGRRKGARAASQSARDAVATAHDRGDFELSRFG